MLGAFSVSQPRLIPCGPTTAHSFFFDLTEAKWDGNRPLHRLCSLMRKMKVQAYTEEELRPNPEIEEESSAAATRCGGTVRTTATRYSFFRNNPPSGNWHDLSESDLLGYAVILRQDLPDGSHRSFVLESVVLPPTIVRGTTGAGFSAEPVSNYYAHCIRECQTALGTPDDHKLFKVRGSFFCQQNALTHVCAHAALRMCINSSPTFRLPKLTNRQINDFLGIDHSDQAPGTGRPRRVGSYGGDRNGGLGTSDIITVLQQLGLQCQFAIFTQNTSVQYEAFIYPLIESRVPVILGIEKPDVAHVITVVGHTLNTDRWEAQARLGYGALPISPYISSSAWADHFIINDDNFGMYVTLPSDMVRNFLVPRFNPNLHAAMAIGIVPGGVTISGYEVEEKAAIQADRIIAKTVPTAENRWLAHLRGSAGNQPKPNIVCRTLLVEKAEYVSQIATATDSDGQKVGEQQISRLNSILPSLLWITEISLPDLYTANKHKLGDIVTKAATTKDEYLRGTNIIFAWLPGLARWGPGLPDPQEQWPLAGHIPLIRTGPVPTSEW